MNISEYSTTVNKKPFLNYYLNLEYGRVRKPNC